MGGVNSSETYHGELSSAPLAPLPGVKIPPPPTKEGERIAQVSIKRKGEEKLGLQFEGLSRRAILNPEGCFARSGLLKDGDEIILIDGEEIDNRQDSGVDQVINILGRNSDGVLTVRFKPKSGVIPEGGEAVPTPLVPDFSRMVCSTITSPPPGYKVALQKPIVWATVNVLKSSLDIYGSNLATGGQAGDLLAACQQQLLQKAHSAGCNAILGLTFNITNDSDDVNYSGGTQRRSHVIFATMMGTPIVLVPETAQVPEI